MNKNKLVPAKFLPLLLIGPLLLNQCTLCDQIDSCCNDPIQLDCSTITIPMKKTPQPPILAWDLGFEARSLELQIAYILQSKTLGGVEHAKRRAPRHQKYINININLRNTSTRDLSVDISRWYLQTQKMKRNVVYISKINTNHRDDSPRLTLTAPKKERTKLRRGESLDLLLTFVYPREKIPDVLDMHDLGKLKIPGPGE